MSCMSYACPYDPTDLEKRQQRVPFHQGRYWEKDTIATCSDVSSFYPQARLSVSSARTRKYGTSCRLSRYSTACPACRFRYLSSKLRQFLLSQKKPYSAVTVQVDRMTSEQYKEDDLSGIIDLIEVIRIQASGPTEAARAIRKKLSVEMWNDGKTYD